MFNDVSLIGNYAKMQGGGIFVSDESIVDVKEIYMSDNGNGDYIMDPYSFSILNYEKLEIL